MTQRSLLIAGNWKMNGSADSTQAFFNALNAANFTAPTVDFLICPPATLLNTAKHAIAQNKLPIATGSQTVDFHTSGAYTGELSPAMVLDAGATFAIVGHSERRQYYAETDETVSQKVAASIESGLVPIACVGETLDERNAGIADKVVTNQTQQALSRVAPGTCPSKLVIAYEPVWAIGTGVVCESDEANRVCGLIRATVAAVLGQEFAQQVRVLYGGSMNPKNAEELLALPDIDGGLIGGASLKADDFTALATIATTLTAKNSGKTTCSV